MCHFITATMSADGDADVVRQVAETHGFKWVEIHNPSLEKYLITGERYYFTTQGTCDCGTSLAAAARDAEASTPRDYNHKLRQFRLRGWSQSKLDRWLAAKTDMNQRKHARLTKPSPGATPDLADWLRFLQATVGCGLVCEIGILVHWYNGGLETESIPIGGRASTPISVASEATLHAIREDTIHVFTAR